MEFTAEIDVMPLQALLDPQGKAVSNSMKHIGLPEIGEVRVGKHITLKVDAATRQEAEAKVEEACAKLLANPIMERYAFRVVEA
jgi:phosphoribosylformylglycinamidine synthase